MNSAIGRKSLPHGIPPHVQLDPEDEVFFITICCLPRGMNQLAVPTVWQVIDESLRIREQRGDLKVRLVLAMPDHLHGLFSFARTEALSKVLSDFKSWIARSCAVKWQRDFFDHRLRGIESAAEKANYIRNNPVRAGLASRPEDWPYQR